VEFLFALLKYGNDNQNYEIPRSNKALNESQPHRAIKRRVKKKKLSFSIRHPQRVFLLSLNSETNDARRHFGELYCIRHIRAADDKRLNEEKNGISHI
jgi:hypothetical protein